MVLGITEKDDKNLGLFDPFREFSSLKRSIADTFDDFYSSKAPLFRTSIIADRKYVPIVDVRETDKEYVIKAFVPGVEQKDINVEYIDGALKVSGELKEEEKLNYLRKESVSGKFERAFSLPEKIKEDAIKAEYKNGVLTVTIPKSEEEKPKIRKIAVQ